jgi:hypothetical protein
LANSASTSSVVVVVSDARGNSQTLSVPLSVGEPAPITLDYTTSNLSRWSHAPLVIGLNGRASGGHPLDSITAWSYKLDGTPVDVPSASNVRIPINDPGEHTVVASVTTRMGASASRSLTILVPANAPPSCSVTGTVASNRRSIALKANCLDPDGVITRYNWFLNGAPVTLSVGGVWTMILPPGVELPVRVDLTVTDDGGATSSSGADFR